MAKFRLKSLKYFAFVSLIVIAFIAITGGIAFYMFPDLHIQSKSPEDLRAMSVEDIASMSKYDGRDYGIVTPSKYQGDSGLCWAYSSISASETNILRSGIDSNATKKNLSLSPVNVGYSRYNRGSDPLGNTVGESIDKDWYKDGDNPYTVARLFSTWCGPTDNNIAKTEDQYENCKYKLVDAVCIDSEEVEDVKLAVAEYGAVTLIFNDDKISKYFNPITDSEHTPNHAVTIIGWDDNISAKKFKPNSASQDGGWIVKNSWYRYSYFYMSYDYIDYSKYAFEYVMNDEYDYNYFYDNDVNSSTSVFTQHYDQIANVFEAKKGEGELSEQIDAVNIGISNSNVQFKVKIYTDLKDTNKPSSGTLSSEISASFAYGGYRTIKLEQPVKIEKGSYFSVVIDMKGFENYPKIILTQSANVPLSDCRIFISDWTRFIPKMTASIKAFTTVA